jgi:hypothetical protein
MTAVLQNADAVLQYANAVLQYTDAVLQYTNAVSQYADAVLQYANAVLQYTDAVLQTRTLYCSTRAMGKQELTCRWRIALAEDERCRPILSSDATVSLKRKWAQFLANLGPSRRRCGLRANWEAQLHTRKNNFTTALNSLDPRRSELPPSQANQRRRPP